MRGLSFGILSSLMLSTGAFALDEYLPLAPRVMELDMGFERGTSLGSFDKSWESVDMENKNNTSIMPLQGKFGLSDGLEGSIGVNFFISDLSEKTGLDRPVLALKYSHGNTGIGGFAAITVPIGFEDILTSGNYASFTFGPMYGKRFGSFGVLANASYTYNSEDENEAKIDNATFFAKPEYVLPLPALKKKKMDLSLTMGLKYDLGFNGTDNVDNSHLFTVRPGMVYIFNNIFSGELISNFPVSGQNNGNYQSVSLNLYITLEETLYNAFSG